jgi:ABC-2 type transport system permease protein
LSGFGNLLRKENSLWWSTKKWWTQSLIWSIVLNGILAIILWANTETPPRAEMIEIFFMLHGAFTAMGVMVLTQGIIVGEKRSGTAAWILTNPVSRTAFVLSKLVGHSIGIIAVLVLLQGGLAYFQISMRLATIFPIIPFLKGVGLLCLHTLFYLTLTLMLGTFFNGRGPVIGIGIGVLVGQNLVGQLLGEFVPWVISLLPDTLLRLTVPVVTGHSLPSDWLLTLVATSILTVSFVIVAILRFMRQEF